MNIALIGSGGREHSICQKLYESPLTKTFIVFLEMRGLKR